MQSAKRKGVVRRLRKMGGGVLISLRRWMGFEKRIAYHRAYSRYTAACGHLDWRNIPGMR